MKFLTSGLILVLAVSSSAWGQAAPGLVAPTNAATASTAGSPAFDNPLQVPDISHVLPAATTRDGVSATLKIFVIMTVLTLARPSS